MNSDTIFAVSTAAGKSAIAVVRVSGPLSDEILLRLCGDRRFVPRRATLTPIFDHNGQLLDRGLVIKFDPPRSFTGEAMAEFQVTGGRAVVQGLLHALSSFAATRPAEPGEFARRAFENRKLDLTEVEGLADVVEAETRVQLRHAQTLASGELRRVCEAVRGDLLGAMAMLEALLDFSDVEDADALSVEGVLPIVSATIQRLDGLLQNSRVAERLRDGMTVVIAGPPNVGKSTLLNCLASRDVAIVSPVAGTTRDAIEVALDIEGFPIILTDTAGLRSTGDPIEKEGIARTRRKIAAADLVLWLSDGRMEEAASERFASPIMEIRTKADLSDGRLLEGSNLAVSAKTGENLDRLLEAIADFARRHFVGAGSLVASSERQRIAVRDVIDALSAIAGDPQKAPELIAEDLRSAVSALGRITGTMDVEEVLGEIFSRLCVGK